MTAPKRVKLTHAERESKRKREGEILSELCGTHGYTMQDVAKKDADRFSICMDTAAGTVATMRVLRLLVPLDSVLCRELDKLAKVESAAAAIMGVRRKRVR